MANHNGQNPGGNQRSGTSNRGFASMDERQQREIARLGGEAVSGNREHMAAIGRKGGEASAESRQNARARLNAAGGDATNDASAQRGDSPGVGRNTPSARSDDADRNLGGRTRSDDGNRASLSGRGRADDDGNQRGMNSPGRNRDDGGNR